MSIIEKQSKQPEKIKPYVDPKWVRYQPLFEARGKFEKQNDYLARVYTLAKHYDRLPGHEQKLIVAAKEDGFHWRGEPIPVFQRMLDEYFKMQAMTEQERSRYRRSFYGFVEELKKQEIDNESFKQQEKLYGEAS